MLQKSIETIGPAVSVERLIDGIIGPAADQVDREDKTPPELIARIADSRYLGAGVGVEHGGLGYDSASLGQLYEAVGGTSATILSLFTVHGMACHVLARWGTDFQKTRLLPRMLDEGNICAFALTEPDVGSDARSVACTATPTDGGFTVNGAKCWISFGQCADLIVLIARAEQGSIALIADADAPGITITPIHNMLGFRGAMLARFDFEDVFVPADRVLGRPGFGFSHIVNSALDLGRFAVGWGCVGIAQACVDLSVEYAKTRRQFDKPLIKHQLVQGMIADMVTQTKAARALCESATSLRDAKDPDAIVEVATAKYFASKTAMEVAQTAVQIHGAYGCSGDSRVERFFRDAKITEIIEGSNQMHQIIIAHQAAMGGAKAK